MKRRLRFSDNRPDAREDVNEEIALYLELRTKEFIEQGMTPEAAREAAIAAFGSVEAVAAEVRAERVEWTRERRRREWTRGFVMDVTYALRTLRKNRAFTLAAIATLTLGIGATTAVYTVANGVLVRPLPYANPSELSMVWMSSLNPQGVSSNLPLATGFYSDLAEQSESFSGVAAFRFWPYAVAGGDGPAEQVPGARVSTSLFSVLGAQPWRGRTFTEGEGQFGGPSAVVLSYTYWQRRFGGSDTVLGTTVQLSGQPFTIVGVMPPGFTFPRGAELPGGFQFRARTDLWTPLIIGDRDRRNYGTQNLAAIARIKPGVTRDGAQAEISADLQRFLDQNSWTAKLSYSLVGLIDQASKGVRRSLLILLGAVGCVLLIACANVANLLVARTGTRTREFAVRAALGAGSARITRQLVTENLVLAGAGTTAGLLLSVWGTRAMLAMVPGSMPRADDIAVDWRVLVLTAAIAAVAGLVFGIASARRVRPAALAAALHAEGTRTTGGVKRRMGRRALVALEVSLSLMLLIAAAQLVQSFLSLQRVDPGFDPRHAVTAGVQVPLPSAFNPAADGPGWQRFFGQLMERMNATPGIQAAGAVSSLPLTGAEEAGRIIIPERPAERPELNPSAHYAIVSGDYFRAMGQRVLAGRTFTAQDGPDDLRVIVVNREFVHRYFADSNIVGRQLQGTFEFTSRAPPRTVIGVVADVQQVSLETEPRPAVYVPQTQMPYPALTVVMRTDGDPGAALGALRHAVKELNPGAAVAQERSLADVFDESLARQRFSSTIITIFAGAALLLAMVGVYGVIAVTVGQRKREIGIRMALGAEHHHVLRLVLGEGARIIAAGVVLGLAGAFATSSLLRAVLYDAGATPAILFAGSALAIAAVSLIATYLPARRASLVDPTLALREE